MNGCDVQESKNIQALVVSTLALMTHWAETGCCESVERVVTNLRQLSLLGSASPEFQTVAVRLSERWVRLRRVLDPGASGIGSRSLH
jgi:hypothetical protein